MKKLVIAGAVCVIAGISYGAYHNLAKREEELGRGLERIAKLMPPYLNHQNTLNKGLFSSQGVYKLNYSDAGKTDTLIINYKIGHGILSWFGGKMDFHSTLHLEGELAKNIEASPTDSMVMDGFIASDGSFNLQGKGAPVTIHVNKESNKNSQASEKIILNDSTSAVVYDKKSGKVEAFINYPLINLINKEDKIDVKELRIARNFNINEPALGDFSFKIAEVINPLANIKGVDIYAKAAIANEKLDILTSIKAADINIIPIGQKNVSFELTYALKSLDKTVLDIYKELSRQEGADISEREKEKIKYQVKNIVKNGATFSLEKLKIKDNKGQIDVSGNLELKPVNKVEDISFAKNTKFNMDVLVDGEYAKMIKALASQENLFITTAKGLKSSLIFEGGVMVINGTPLPASYVEELNSKLEQIDETIHKNSPQ